MSIYAYRNSERVQWPYIYKCVCVSSHDTDDVTRRELVATHGTTNNVEEIIADLVHVILLKELHSTLSRGTRPLNNYPTRLKGRDNHTFPLMLGSHRKARRVIRARLSQWLV